MNSTKEEEEVNNIIPQAQAPIPTRELNETMFREEEEGAPKEMAKEEEKEIVQEEEVEAVFLPPSQKGKDNIVLDEVIGMSVNNANEYQRKKTCSSNEIEKENRRIVFFCTVFFSYECLAEPTVYHGCRHGNKNHDHADEAELRGGQ